MTTEQHKLGGFEERLLNELRALVVAQPSTGPERPARSPRARVAAAPRRRLAFVGVVAALLVVAVGTGVPFLTDGAAPAYAVSSNEDGTVSVEISALKDAAGLESKLREVGIRAVVQYLPPRKACKQPWFTPASPPSQGSQPSFSGVQHTSDGRTRFTISKNVPADTTLVIMSQTASGAGGPEGAESIGVAFAKGEVKECEIVDAPAGAPPFGPPPAGGQLHTERGSGPGLSTSK